jgi:carbamoyl-phosphate synthase large subunit
VARRLAVLGVDLAATAGTAAFLEEQGLRVRTMQKVHDEARPHVVDHLINGEIHLVVNTPLGRESHEDDGIIRRTALKHEIPCITTLSGAMAAAEGIAALKRDGLAVRPLQEMHRS